MISQKKMSTGLILWYQSKVFDEYTENWTQDVNKYWKGRGSISLRWDMKYWHNLSQEHLSIF